MPTELGTTEPSCKGKLFEEDAKLLACFSAGKRAELLENDLLCGSGERTRARKLLGAFCGLGVEVCFLEVLCSFGVIRSFVCVLLCSFSVIRLVDVKPLQVVLLPFILMPLDKWYFTVLVRVEIYFLWPFKNDRMNSLNKQVY